MIARRLTNPPTTSVPNAPCGVERIVFEIIQFHNVSVPNAPCGVERMMLGSKACFRVSFLMHRVELKGGIDRKPQSLQALQVPNAPCGVERV